MSAIACPSYPPARRLNAVSEFYNYDMVYGVRGNRYVPYRVSGFVHFSYTFGIRIRYRDDKSHITESHYFSGD